MAGVQETSLVVECISARLMKVRIHLEGKSNGVSFVVGYAPTLGSRTRETDHFWNALDSVVTGVPSGDHWGSQWGPPICPRGCEFRDGQTTERVRGEQGARCIRA